MNKERQEVEHWLKMEIAKASKIDAGEVSVSDDFFSFNIDSVGAATIAAELSDFIDQPVDPGVFWDFENISQLLDWLYEE